MYIIKLRNDSYIGHRNENARVYIISKIKLTFILKAKRVTQNVSNIEPDVEKHVHFTFFTK